MAGVAAAEMVGPAQTLATQDVKAAIGRLKRLDNHPLIGQQGDPSTIRAQAGPTGPT